MPAGSELLPRFSRAQRFAHWAFAAAFVILVLTGLVLTVKGLSPLAAGGASRFLHRHAAVMLIAAPFYYLLFDRVGLKRLICDSFRYDADDLRWLKAMPRYVFGQAKGMPPQGRLNAGEKLHHAAIVVLFCIVVLSGLLLWCGRPFLGAGPFAWVLVAHDISMGLMTILTLGHLYFVFVYGALGGMMTGCVTRAYAELEHAKWLAELDGAKGEENA
jgi:formate dehydrogenase subunit gamma